MPTGSRTVDKRPWPLLYGPERLQAQARRELMSDLRQKRPLYIVLPAGSGLRWKLPAVTISADPFPELLDFVATNYVREAVLGNSAIYRLRETSSIGPYNNWGDLANLA